MKLSGRWYHNLVTGVVIVLLVVGCLYVGLRFYFAERLNEDGRPLPPRGLPSLALLKYAYMFKLLHAVNVEPDIPSELEYLQDIPYKIIHDDTLRLDIVRPQKLEAPPPLLIFIHGGAWKTGNKADYLLYLVDFANRGYVTASVGYRLSKVALFPAAVQDVVCAVRWLRQHASDYGYDPDRIAVIGGSAGGHLALMVGYAGEEPLFNQDCAGVEVPCRVQAVVDIYGAADLITDFAKTRRSVHQFLGGQFDEIPEKYRLASPSTYLSADGPPTLIFHGTIDRTVPVAQSDTLAARLKQLGVPVEYHRLNGWPHVMDIVTSVNQYMQFHMADFFRRHLGKTGTIENNKQTNR